jgi:hypothetical protein
MGTPDWLASVCRVPCVIYNRVKVGVDEYGNDVYDDVGTGATCFVQPSSAEQIQDGRAEVGTWLMHFGAEVAGRLDGFSRIDVFGMSFEATGPPMVYPDMDAITNDPTPVHHVEQLVTRSTA